jgi:hypothetical protein
LEALWASVAIIDRVGKGLRAAQTDPKSHLRESRVPTLLHCLRNDHV